MKLGINIVRLSRKFTGVGRYIECLLNEWAQMDIPFDEIILYTPRPIQQSDVLFPLDAFTIEVLGSHRDRPPPDPIWEWRHLRNRRDVDLMFFPAYTLPVGNRNRCVVTYHGPAENKLGSKEGLRSWLYDKLYRYSARKADHVLVVSDAVKQRVMQHFAVNENKMTTTLLAASPVFHPQNDAQQQLQTRLACCGADVPFIFFVGKLSRRHFIPELLAAFAAVSHRSNHKLLIAGPDYLGIDVPQRARDLGLAERIVYRPYIEHRDLVEVYNAADFFVFPASDIEGFGLPVIEAMSCGTPVISSRKGSIPEFASDAALLVESNSSDALAAAMTRLITDVDFRNRLGRQGLARSASISWRQTAERTMTALWNTL